MKIYNVQILRDMSNNYNGLDDTKIYTFATLEEAAEKLSTEYTKAVDFLAKDVPVDLLEIEKRELDFLVHDGCDYIHGIIREAELNLDIFAITTVSVDPYEPASVSTYFRYSKEDADLEYEEIKNNLYNDKLEEFDTEEDEEVSSQDKLDEFISNHVQHDYEFTNGNRYFHVVHDEGKELIISTERLTFGDNK